MTLPAIADVYRILYFWGGPDGGTATTRYHVKSDHTLSPEELLGLGGAVLSFETGGAGDGLLSFVCSSWNLVGIRVQALDGTRLTGDVPMPAWPGWQPVGPYAPNTAMTLAILTAESWRGGHAHVQLPGVPLDSMEATGGAIFSDAAIGVAVLFAQAWQAAVAAIGSGDGGPVNLGTLRYRAHGAPIVGGPVFLQATGVQPRRRIGTERRRTGKRQY